MKSYHETLEYLYSQLPMFQRSGAAAYKNTLGNTLVLDQMYDHPHRSFKTIHVAGTNGKGSSSHMLASVLQQAGYKVGLYTSPHLVDFRERIRINGALMSESAVVEFVHEFQVKNEAARLEPSFFEITVAMAFWYFKQMNVDIAVIEVGLGGRLDSTNIILPEVSLITNISFDHMSLLGNTIAEIATEKAGIIKAGVPVVVSESNQGYNSVFTNKANAVQAPLFFADDEYVGELLPGTTGANQSFNFLKNGVTLVEGLQCDLLGNYQRKNIAGVLKTINILIERGFVISTKNIYEGISRVKINTGLRGRWEVAGVNPMLVCDTGHNEAGIELVVDQIRTTVWEKLYMVIGMVNDKSIDTVLSLLPREAHYIFTQAAIPRALDAGLLAKQAARAGLSGEVIPNVKQAVAYALALANLNDFVFVGGSTFVVADYFS